ncbi:MAG TPA: ParB/RepB/Spo0J family partition protein [Candidatus Cloacimonadota bacterium]|nr:ParB/RepB/Spo0J family partition protein [Candidatus Cloacimonadota bacterium]HPT71620.1 ParB/RepB/Spo0J family partition protein [Candidatus Cloacimonadota bacterium]
MNERLGRGLEALIRDIPESTNQATGITTVRVDHISPNRYQPRKTFDTSKLQELSDSIKQNGIIQPIIVTKKDDSDYELIAGERRLEAAKLAGFEEVPVIIRSVSKKEQLQFAIIENIQRENLSAIEEARAYQQLVEEFSMTHAQISEIMGKDRVTITNSLRLLRLSPEIQDYIVSGNLTAGHARAILQVVDEHQEGFAKYLAVNNCSVRQAEELSKTWEQPQTHIRQQQIKNHSHDIEETELKQLYRVNVKIDDKNGRGKIIFKYSSEEEKKQLLEQLMKQ